MIDIRRFSLNRIVCPSMALEDFFALAQSLGLSKVELRNDLPGGEITDGIPPARAEQMAERHGIEVMTINAVQKFNLGSALAGATEELKRLLDIAATLRCNAIVLCPNNDFNDSRSEAMRMEETVKALAAFGSSFVSRGMLGYVEPLGFAECSLSSLVTAGEAIRRSGFSCYRTVFDTFHHFLGPDKKKDIGAVYPVSNTGLVHASGVESSLPDESIRDEHRLLPTSLDRTDCKGQIARLVELGYAGDISLEPFSPAVQGMHPDALASALRKSIDFLRG